MRNPLDKYSTYSLAISNSAIKANSALRNTNRINIKAVIHSRIVIDITKSIIQLFMQYILDAFVAILFAYFMLFI